MNILQKIVDQKRFEIGYCQLEKPAIELEKMPMFKRECYSLNSYLLAKIKTGIIAEFKRRSPSKGIINDSAFVEDVVVAYERFGASAISVLTDSTFFGGSLIDLQKARKCTIPILRKDFIINEYQVIETKAYGADVILLIAACLKVKEVKLLAALAKTIGLNVLLEIHDQSELDHICDYVDAVGINTRDLKTFEVDREKSAQLVKSIPGSLTKIAESGIETVYDICTLRQSGFNGFLIGERFMKEKNPGEAFKTFVKGL